MSKISYPSDGIYKYSKTKIETCSNDLYNAMSYCDFDIPYDFVYKNYLNGLSNDINNYYKEVNNINDILRSTDNNYSDLENDLSFEVSKLKSIQIKDRDRMII